MRWYPASFNRPKTAFTFDLLETYHKVTLQGKLNLFDFYHAIMHKSDNQGRSKPMVSGLKRFKLFFIDQFAYSIVIMKSPAVCVSGGISRVSNAGVALIKNILFPQQHPDPLQSNVPPAPILSGTFRRIGTVSPVLTSE
jgi:hypothetical protein